MAAAAFGALTGIRRINFVGNKQFSDSRLREAIQTKLLPIAPAAQVLIGHQPGHKTTVDLVSGVPTPGSFPLPDRDFTVLGLLALGGGIPRDMQYGPSRAADIDAEFIGHELANLHVDALPHFGRTGRHLHRAVGVHVDERVALV